MKLLDQFPKPVLSALTDGRWLPIVGAGFSRNAIVPEGAAVPLWDQLGKLVGNDIPGYTYVSPIDALSEFEYAFDRRELVKRLHAALMIDDAQPGPVHDAFCRLPFDRVVTTNFDFLLERGYERLGVAHVPIVLEEQLALVLERETTALVKLHGDLRHPVQLVATEDDFDGFLARRPVFATHVSNLLVERMPILIGYSLDDPDLRQLLATLKDRLGDMAPAPFAIGVGMSQAAIARFNRRGVKVINLPGSSRRYSEILATAFAELNVHWREQVLAEVDVIREPPLEQLRVAPTREGSRLCFFSVPRNLLAFYQEQIFPLAEQVGLVPVSPFDIESSPGNLIAAVRALIERSRYAVIDLSENPASIELAMATELVGLENVLVVTPETGPPGFVDRTLPYVRRPIGLEDEGAFFGQLQGWFAERGVPERPGFDAERLLALGEYPAAAVAAMTELEEIFQRLNLSLGTPIASRRGPTLWQMLSDPALPIPDDLRGRLRDWIGVRNAVVHGGGEVTRQLAEGIVADVAKVRSMLSR